MPYCETTSRYSVSSRLKVLQAKCLYNPASNLAKLCIVEQRFESQGKMIYNAQRRFVNTLCVASQFESRSRRCFSIIDTGSRFTCSSLGNSGGVVCAVRTLGCNSAFIIMAWHTLRDGARQEKRSRRPNNAGGYGLLRQSWYAACRT